MKSRIAAAVYLLAFAALAGDFTVSNVRIRQRWPWDKKVDIDFDLVAAAPADVTFRFFDGDRELSIPSTALSGDIYGVSTGARRIVLDPEKTEYASETFLSFRAEVAASESPLYLIADLEKDAGAEGQLTYVTKSDLDAGLYGACVTNPVAGVSSLVWTDVTNDIYKTTKLVFRRVNPGSFKTGGCGYCFGGATWLPPSEAPATNTAVITQPYYIAVFETTKAQFARMTGGSVSDSDGKLPAANYKYNDLRGSGWPQDGYSVKPNSHIDKMRAKLGLDYVDLPTDMQWEFACKAGATYLMDDNVVRDFDTFKGNEGSTAINALINVFNDDAVAYGVLGQSEVENVGAYLPNAFGLYDMHGNVQELCLDWAPVGRVYRSMGSYVDKDASLSLFRVDSTDYAGCESGTGRIVHGGYYGGVGTKSTAAFRASTAPATAFAYNGFRLVCYPKGVTPVVGDITPDVTSGE